MAIPNKERRKLRRKLLRIDEKQDMILTFMVSQIFIIFCVSLLFDQIAGRFFTATVRYTPGTGWGQYLISGVCLYLIVVLWRVMK